MENRWRRWIWVFLALAGLFVALHSAKSPTTDDDAPEVFGDVTYWPRITNEKLATRDRTQIGKENAVIYMLVRNWEIHEALESIRQIEDRFNHRYKYPWVFLNDKPFDDHFKILTSGMVSGEAQYGFVEPEDWNIPPHINRTRMQECMDDMVERDIIYGGSHSYRNMCRYNSGKFFWHPLLQPFDWYWRVEPGIKLFCDQLYDPFTFLRQNDKVYGFVITIPDVPATVRTLWKTANEFFTNKGAEYIAPDNGLEFGLDWRGWEHYIEDPLSDTIEGYNLCHFWSNFEIGSLNFFRTPAYTAYFNHLDESGGFYYERWGDAPVHTLGLLALANSSQIHHFSDIGYYHIPFWRCPHDSESYETGRCLCPDDDDTKNVDFQPFSCLPRWWRHAGRQLLYNFPQDT